MRTRTALVVAAPVLAVVVLVGTVAALAGLGGGTDRARVVVAEGTDDPAVPPTDDATTDDGPDLWYGPTDDGSDGTTDRAAPGLPDATTTSGTPAAGTTSGTSPSGTTTSGTTSAPASSTSSTSSTTTTPPSSSSSSSSSPPPTTTTTRPPTTTTTTTAPGPDDPRYPTCKSARAHGYGPYRRGVDPEYAWYPDPDGDGVACG